MQARFSNLKMDLGTDLVSQVDSLRSEYIDKGITYGAVAGVALGATAAAIFTSDMDLSLRLTSGAVLGASLFTILGSMVGMEDARRAVKVLADKNPEQRQNILDYDSTRRDLTYHSMIQ